MAAMCAMRKDNERDAHDYLERALKLDPNYYPALINLAQLKYRPGELDAAPQPRGSLQQARRADCGIVVACIAD